jgi:DNA (cytosine-5)-methyltransferase 1
MNNAPQPVVLQRQKENRRDADFSKIESIDLFCGVGGLTRGVLDSGIKVLAGLDLDGTCEYAYTKNNGIPFIKADVSQYDSSALLSLYSKNSVRVLMGCAPCQPFSKLQQKNIEKNENSKWGLLYSFLRHIKAIKPDIISMENVPELVGEKVFLDFKTSIEGLGYFVDYKVVNACDYGVPQRRKRLLFLASAFGPIHLIPPTTPVNRVTVRDTIFSLPKISAGETDPTDSLHRTSALSAKNLKRIQASKPGGTWKDWPPQLLPKCYKKKKGKTFKSVYGRMEWDKVGPTLTTQFMRYGTGRYGHPEQDRALSLREGALLQTFPITYQFSEDSNYSIGDVARQIGNAVPVKLGEVVGLSIKEHLLEVKKHGLS